MAEQYKPGEEELKVIGLIKQRFDTAKQFFKDNVKDKCDSFYKDYREYAWDRQALLNSQNLWWKSNTFIPLTSSYIRWVDARVKESLPELKIIWRNEDDMKKAEKIQTMLEYIWEKDKTSIEVWNFVKHCEIYGTWVWKVTWKTKRVITTKEIIDDETLEKKDVKDYSEEYDDPTFNNIDLYSFFPDPQWNSIESCRYVCQRHLMTKWQILLQFKDMENTEFFENWSWDLEVLDTVRVIVNKQVNTKSEEKATDEQIEVIEYWEDDKYVLLVWWVLAINKPNPYPFKKKPFIKSSYESLPFEFYWVWLAEQLSQSQKLINTVRNQRIDNVTMSLQPMSIINDMAIENEEDLTWRPFGTIRVLWQDLDNTIRPLTVPQVWSSAYNEDSLIFDAARQATGLDAYSIWQSEAASASASSVIASKEASALRIKSFIRNLELELYEPLFRMWLELWREFYPNDTIKQVVNIETWLTENVASIPKDFRKEENGQFTFEQISKDDLYWYFDFRVLSSSWIAASKELNKQNSLQLLDRAVTAWTNPQTWEEYVNKKALWKLVLKNLSVDPSEFMGTNTQTEKQDWQTNMELFNEQKQLDQQKQAEWGWWNTWALSQIQWAQANLSWINASAPQTPWTTQVSPNQQ